MRDRTANYEIVNQAPVFITIRDLGPWDKFMTVTNAAEEVVEELFVSGELAEGQRLFYYDSSGELDEIVTENRRFKKFMPGRWRTVAGNDVH